MLASKKALTLMGLLYIMATVLSGSTLFISVILISLAAAVIKTGFTLNWFRPPSRLTVRSITVLGIICLVTEGIIHRQAGIAAINLLVLGCALKFLEYSSERDSFVHAAALVFLSILPLIFHYQIFIALYLALAGILIVWIYISLTRRSTVGEDLRLMLRLFLPALPLTAVLFLILPRFGSFWVLPGNEKSGITGISTSFSVRNLENLYQSDKLVARVGFRGDMPSPLYFRVMTYSRYRNDEWSQDLLVSQDQNRIAYNPFAKSPKPKPSAPGGIEYDVMLEPTGTVFIPSLKFSGNSNDNAFYNKDDTYTVNKPAGSRELFHFTWYPEYTPETEKLYSRSFLRLIPGDNPRTAELTRRLTGHLAAPREKAEAIYSYFKNGFSYTLKPGRNGYQGRDHIDYFLMDSKSGFCVHYAEAMAIMLRMAGIPSRIVSGYAGGETVPDLNLVIIREYDAHAWTEAYIDGHWVTYDPVLLVSREFSQGQGYVTIRNGNEAPSGIAAFLKKLRDITENLEYSWSRFILNFDMTSQEQLLKNSLPLIFSLVFGGIALYVIFFLATLFGKKKLKRDPEEIRIMKRILQSISGTGITVETRETPEAVAAKLTAMTSGDSGTGMPAAGRKTAPSLNIRNCRDLAAEFAAAAALFRKLRYQRPSEKRKEIIRELRTHAEKIIKICTTS